MRLQAVFAECLFVGNVAHGSGAAIEVFLSDKVTVRRCTFVNNTVVGVGGSGAIKVSHTILARESLNAFYATVSNYLVRQESTPRPISPSPSSINRLYFAESSRPGACRVVNFRLVFNTSEAVASP